MSNREMHSLKTRPLVVSFLIVLFVIGTLATLISVISLTVPGSFLEMLWQLNPHAREGFARMGNWSIVLMSVLCVICFLTAIGLWRGLRWGYWMSILMLAGNLIGSVINVAAGTEPRAIIGIPVASLLLVFLVRAREYFQRAREV